MQLQNAVKSNLLAHAYLLVGEKTKTLDNARMLAMAVNCPEVHEGYPCEKCLSCRKILHGNHPDVSIIEPKGASFKIEQVRALQKSINYKHYEGAYKVLILTGADTMTVEAANSLLKVLEEPPTKTIFILIAENGNNILPTIQSRCQIIKFGGQKEETEDVEKIREFYDTKVVDLINRISDMDYYKLLDFSDMLEKDKDNIKIFLSSLAQWLRDIAVVKLTGQKELMGNQHLFLDAQNCTLKPAKVLEAVLEVQNSEKLLNQNVNMRLALDVLLLKLYRLAV